MVSEMYSRVLAIASLLLAWTLLWATIRDSLFSRLGNVFGFEALLLLGLPAAFLILMILVRTVPVVIPPKLVVKHASTVTTLGLAGEGEPQETKSDL